MRSKRSMTKTSSAWKRSAPAVGRPKRAAKKECAARSIRRSVRRRCNRQAIKAAEKNVRGRRLHCEKRKDRAGGISPAGLGRRFCGTDENQRDDCAGNGEGRADEHDRSKSGDERIVDRAANQLLRRRILIRWNLDGRKFGRLFAQRLTY